MFTTMICLYVINRQSLYITIIITQFVFLSTLGVKCSNKPKSVLKYHLIERCRRSKVAVISYANYTSLKSCQRLGIERNGMAINFSPPEAWDTTINYTCEILKCAEVNGGSTLVNDTRFDYYSSYAKPLPHFNASCVSALGMFYLIPQKMNFTEARGVCKNMTGVLSEIIDQQRTDALALLLSGANVGSALVGLRRHNFSSYDGEYGNNLECTTYRAWAPGHPRTNSNNFDCMLITRSKTWESTSCNKTYPSLCELLPGGPYKKRKTFYPKLPVTGFS